MKKTVLVLTLAMMACMPAAAITDSELMTQALTMQQQGLDEMSIAKQLLAQGATMDQLQKLKVQATQLKSTTKSQNNTSQTAERTNNGETRSLQQMLMPQKPRTKKVFGQDIFRSMENGFEPQMNQATPKNYTLGAGDEVIIDIYGASQLQIKQTISADGKITISNYGPVQLSGLTISEATRRLKSTIGTRYQGCQIQLTLGQTRSISINVMGEVEMPGTYRLSAFADVFNALNMAGGVSESGTLRDIKVFRNGQQAASVDIYGYLMDGTLQGNIRLEDGDIVIVGAYQELVEVQGKVKRPMYFEMKTGEMLDKLLYYAGGFSGDAYTDAVRVSRKNAGAQSVSTVTNAQFGLFRMMDGDKVTIDSILPRLKNTVEVQGAVFRPGFYGMDNVKTVKQMIEAADGPSEDAFLGRAVLYRMKIDRTYQAIAIDLKGILDGSAEDIELKNEDQLFVPSKQNKLENQYVVIHGEVFLPDTFRFAENESVEDLILRAGGLTEQASTSKVDIARRVIDAKATKESTVKSETFEVQLNDSLSVTEHGFQLEPFDEVYVRQSPAFGRQMNVAIRGEVLFGGTYSLKTQDDRLSELVKAAGGLNSHAYVKGARLQRRMTEDEMLRRDQLKQINQAASSKDSVDLSKLDMSDTYWVGIDLEKALAKPGSDEDIVLREGDVLIVPSMNSTVKINGEVLYPNTVSYIKGKRAKFYIDQAGGYSNQARRLRAYIIYTNGKVAPAHRGKVLPGSEIVVPTRPERKSNAAQWVSIATASASLASVAATITTLIINATK